MSARQTPNEFLKQIIGRPVVVKLNNGVDYRGMTFRIKALFYHIVHVYTFHFHRSTCLPRWLHEYCAGTDRRIQ